MDERRLQRLLAVFTDSRRTEQPGALTLSAPNRELSTWDWRFAGTAGPIWVVISAQRTLKKNWMMANYHHHYLTPRQREAAQAICITQVSLFNKVGRPSEDVIKTEMALESKRLPTPVANPPSSLSG